jgi:hypothetical protein
MNNATSHDLIAQHGRHYQLQRQPKEQQVNDESPLVNPCFSNGRSGDYDLKGNVVAVAEIGPSETTIAEG